jgi:TolB protein
MDELALLRQLVADEPMDDEGARAEVWRRLREGETSPRHPTTVREVLAQAIDDEDLCHRRTGRRRRWGLVAAAAVLLLGGVVVTPALGIGSRLLDLIQDRHSPRETREPAWSPDGRKIAYVSRRDQNSWDLYVVDADGSGPRKLTSVASASTAWSPDGRKIAFQGARLPRREPQEVGPGRPSGLFHINADGSGRQMLARPGAHPTWSPDGRKIAFLGGGEIYVVNADGSGRRRLTQRGGPPTWSPDGRKIAFLSPTCDHGCYHVYVVNADGSGERRLTRKRDAGVRFRANGDPAATQANLTLAWSPDGRRIAFVRRRVTFDQTTPDVGSVWVMNADGRQQRRLTRETSPRTLLGPAAPYARLAWSPGGRKLVFTSERDGNAEVYVVNSDGSRIRRLTNNPGYDGDATWSADGRRLVFVSDRDGTYAVYVMNADGSGQRRLTKGGS